MNKFYFCTAWSATISFYNIKHLQRLYKTLSLGVTSWMFLGGIWWCFNCFIQALILVDNDSERSTQLRKEVKTNSFSSNYRNVILIPNDAGLKLIESYEPNNDLREKSWSSAYWKLKSCKVTADWPQMTGQNQDLNKSVIIKLNQ